MTLISFTINGTSYQADEGMTWAEWCESAYNNGGWFISGTMVCSSDGSYIDLANPSGTIKQQNYLVVDSK